MQDPRSPTGDTATATSSPALRSTSFAPSMNTHSNALSLSSSPKNGSHPEAHSPAGLGPPTGNAFPDLLGPTSSLDSHHHSSSLSPYRHDTANPGTHMAAGTGEQVVAVSSYFHAHRYPLESDLVLRSSDGVWFYLHTEYINQVSDLAVSEILRFSSQRANTGPILLPDPARVLNIIFHAVYRASCADSRPSCYELVLAVDCMPKYGLVPKDLIHDSSPLYDLLIAFARAHPIAIYALAAHHDIEPLAIQASSQLVDFPLNQIDDTTAVRMGPTYLRRLFLLHVARTEFLKRELLRPPCGHPMTEHCNTEMVTRAWALGSASLAWDVTSGITAQRIQSVFEPLVSKIPCTDCQKMFDKRIQDVMISCNANATIQCV